MARGWWRFSAWAHSRSPIVFEDPNFEHRDYIPWMAYGQSKTANILFALALDERGKAHGVRAFSLHPGSIVDTGLSKYLSPEALRAAGLVDEDGNPIIDGEEPKDGRARGGDQCLVRDEPAARRHGRRLLPE